MADMTLDQTYRILALFFGLFFPPIAVLMVDGITCQLLINILLTLFGFLPGIIHAFWVILKVIPILILILNVILKADSADTKARADGVAHAMA